jgi:hypothetical protein
MEEHIATRPAERPVGGAEADAGAGDGSGPAQLGPPHLADPRALMILTTEHWGLLTARSLVYNEAFARAGMFLTFLSASLVAIGFLAQASGFGREFLVATAILLGFDLVIGLATLGRVSSASTEEFRALQAMARLRHAYLEMVPTLDPYISSSRYDDVASVLQVYGATPERPSVAGDFVHGLTTTPGMISLICAVVAGGLVGSIGLMADMSPMLGVIAAVAGGVGTFVALWVIALRRFQAIDRTLDVRFPPPAPR